MGLEQHEIKKMQHTHIDNLSLSLTTSSQLSLCLLCAQGGELFAYFIVYFKVLGHTSVDAHRLAFGQVRFVVFGRNTLFVTRIGHSSKSFY
jgi:hypothetical protein